MMQVINSSGSNGANRAGDGDGGSATTVIYNADCPICRREIEHYRSVARTTDAPLRFETLTEGAPERLGLTRDQAARRLHVVRDGEVESGLEAFRALWSAMPRYRWLAWLTGLPGVGGLAGWAYDRVAAPLLYAMHRRREAGSARRA